MPLFSRETLLPKTWCVPLPDKFVNSSWTVSKTFLNPKGDWIFNPTQIWNDFVSLSQVKWEGLTWCSTRFLLVIVATIQVLLVLLALLATRGLVESLGRAVAQVSLEVQVYLEIKEKEVLSQLLSPEGLEWLMSSLQRNNKENWEQWNNTITVVTFILLQHERNNNISAFPCAV